MENIILLVSFLFIAVIGFVIARKLNQIMENPENQEKKKKR